MSGSCGTSSGCLSTDTITIPSGVAGADGTNGTSGTDGAAGAAGANGVFGGFSGNWIYSSSTASGPGATLLRFSDADPTADQSVYVNILNAESIDYSKFLGVVASGSGKTVSYGTVRIWKRYDSTTFWIGIVDGSTDNTTDFEISLEHVLNNGTFVDGDELVMSYQTSGPAGEASTEVNAGIIGFETEVVISAGDESNSTFVSHTIPHGNMSSNGDSIEAEAYIVTDATQSRADGYFVSIGDQGYTLDANELIATVDSSSAKAILIKVRIMRYNGNKTYCTVTAERSFLGDGKGTVMTTSMNTLMSSHNHTVDWTLDAILEIGVISSAVTPTILESELLTFSAKYIPSITLI